jgi:hypothetical protein
MQQPFMHIKTLSLFKKDFLYIFDMETQRKLWHPRVHYRIQNSTSLDPSLKYISPVQLSFQER